MSKIKLTGHGSGSGTLTIQAPDTDSARTITLPDADVTLGASPVTALNNATANELVTVGATTTELDAESGLTFDGTNLTLTSSDIVFATAGKGICLGVTTNTDENTLDDYEEGTWTPTLIGSGGGTGTLTNYGGFYIKIGRLVYVYCYIVCTGLGSMSGDVRIGGLPFTVHATGGYNSVTVSGAEGLAIGAGESLTGFTQINDTYIKLQDWDVTTGTSFLTTAEFTADGGGVFVATYFA